MSEELPNRVAEGLRLVRASTAAGLAPPGVAAVQRTVRRRRIVRSGLAAVLLAIVIPLAWQAGRPAVPDPMATPTPSVSPTASPSASAAPSAPPTLGNGGAASPVAPRSTAPRPPAACNANVSLSGGRMWVQGGGDWDTPACAGTQIPVFWVTYRTVDGQLTRYRSGEYTLTHANPEVTFSVAYPPEYCGYRVYLGRGRGLPATVPAGAGHSYWNSLGIQLLSSEGGGSCPTPSP